GQPIIIKPGIFKEYNISLVNHSLKDIDYDDTIESLIAQKKQAEQAKAVAITNAEKALQDAITAEAQGQARIAQAKADQEVEKITEVTQAEKNRDVAVLKAEQELKVAELNRQKAEQDAQAELVRKRADAEANKLLVTAGLTPQQKLDGQIKIADLVSKNLATGIAQADFPRIVVNGGAEDSSGGGVDLVTMMGLNQAMELVDKMSANSVK
ncbi:MAG: hypothetical protein PQJ46_01495, partial [Spirochaetales bacterium]|nr:hypothetical protein [Spirochaetales bacterium]